jgi:hypothetical protein
VFAPEFNAFSRRLVGLAAVNAVVESEAMYRPTAEFQAQANQILPALIRNMKYATIEVLEQEQAFTLLQCNFMY